MKQHTLTRRAAAACAGLIAAATLTACSGGDGAVPGTDHSVSGTNHSAAAGNAAASGKPGTAVNSVDVMFAQTMIPHHRQAVAMANLAGTRAASAEVKQLAAQIRAAQDPEITMMTDWLTAWGQPTAVPSGHATAPAPGMSGPMPGMTPMPGMSGPMPGMMSDADMAALRTARGRDFDRRFLQMMIGHHQGVVAMARAEQAGGANPDAKALASRIIQTQQTEINSMQKMLNQR